MDRRLRPFTADDLPRIAALMRISNARDPRIDVPDEQALAAFASLDSNRSGRDFIVGEAVDASGRATLEAVLMSGRFTVADRDQPIRGFRVIVAPDAHAAGWADRLLDAVEDQDPPSAVARRTVVGADWARARVRLEARGYGHIRSVEHLRRSGLPPPRPVLPRGFVLRDADPHRDGEALIDLYNTAHAKAFGFAPLTVDDLLVSVGAPGGRFLVLDAPDGDLAGAVHTLPYLSGIGLLHAVQVAPRLHGQGLGRILVSSALNALAQQGFGIVELAVDADNAPARSLYVEMGFAPIGRDLIYEKRPGCAGPSVAAAGAR